MPGPGTPLGGSWIASSPCGERKGGGAGTNERARGEERGGEGRDEAGSETRRDETRDDVRGRRLEVPSSRVRDDAEYGVS